MKTNHSGPTLYIFCNFSWMEWARELCLVPNSSSFQAGNMLFMEWLYIKTGPNEYCISLNRKGRKPLCLLLWFSKKGITIYHLFLLHFLVERGMVYQHHEAFPPTVLMDCGVSGCLWVRGVVYQHRKAFPPTVQGCCWQQKSWSAQNWKKLQNKHEDNINCFTWNAVTNQCQVKWPTEIISQHVENIFYLSFIFDLF